MQQYGLTLYCSDLIAKTANARVRCSVMLRANLAYLWHKNVFQNQYSYSVTYEIRISKQQMHQKKNIWGCFWYSGGLKWWVFFLYRGTKSERQKRLSWSRQANIWRRYTKEKETQRRVRHTQSQLWWLCLGTSWIFRKLMLPKLMCLDGERC